MSSILSQSLITKLTRGKVKQSNQSGLKFGNSSITLPSSEHTGDFAKIIQNDFFYITVNDLSGDTLLSTQIPANSSTFETLANDSLLINIGSHLRGLGFETGIFNVSYDFLRRKAGFFESYFIDNTGELYLGNIDLDETGQVYKIGEVQNDDSVLGEIEGSLEIVDISPSRTEIAVGKSTNLLNKIYLDESTEYFNPSFTYFFTATNSTYSGNWTLPYISRHSFINQEVIDKFALGGILSGQISHNDDAILLGKSNKIIQRDIFDSVYQDGNTKIVLKDFFVVSIDEVPITKSIINTDIEAQPMESPIGVNGNNNTDFTGALSVKEQWVYDGAEDSWIPNLNVIQTDEDGNFNFNTLVDGIPLPVAIKKNLINWPFDDSYEFGGSGSGGDSFNLGTFQTKLREWFHKNKNILFKFVNINGEKYDWGQYGVFDATSTQITEGSVFQFFADFNIHADRMPSSINRESEIQSNYFYLDDINDLSKLVDRTETEILFEEHKVYTDFIADIKSVVYDGDFVDRIILKYSPKEFAEKAGIFLYEEPTDDTLYSDKPMFFENYKSQIQNLTTYLYFNSGFKTLICNSKTGDGTTGIFKLTDPLPEDVFIGAPVYIVEELFSSKNYNVELVPWLESPVPTTILIPPDNEGVGDVIQPVTTEYKTWSELSFQSSSLYRDIINKVISGSIDDTELNIDYSMYDNFVHFSSAEKRLRNFKYKIDLLEGYEQESSSMVGLYSGSGDLGNDPNTVVTGSQSKLDSLELKIDELKNNFDGYEKYLYQESASYTTSSFGIHYDATWPKSTTSKPHTLYNSSQSIASTWYDNQIISASDYDTVNKDYLINHLPEHVIVDGENEVFLRLVKMVGQHFDNIKNYIDEFGTIHDRQESLTKGLPKQLTSTIAKSMGWEVAGGYDLVEIDEYATGKKVSQDNSVASSSSVPLQDVSKEIWSRILTNMPLFLKSKGTLKALKGLINCYGIPSTILRVREYGGPTKNEVNPDFEAVRRFSKALDFKQEQYVETKWSDSSDTSMKPKTVEFRFKAVSSSNMNLIQQDDNWNIWLKENGSVDNIGSIAFSISGSYSGSQEVTSSALPFFNGDYWSVMLRKELVNEDILTTRIHSGSAGSVTGSTNFETGSLQNPFESSAGNGTLEVISQSAYIFDGSYSLGLKNDNTAGEVYTYPYTNNDDGTFVSTYGDARVASASFGETFEFNVYARSKSTGANIQLWVMELGTKGNILENSYTYYPSLRKNYGYGALHQAEYNVGTKWERYNIRAKINHPNTQFIGLRLDNNTGKSTVYFDKGELRKLGSNAIKFDIIAKQFDAGRDVIQYETKESLIIDGLSNSASSSYTGSWETDGDLFIGGKDNTFVSSSNSTGNLLSGSMMEFRLWSTPLDEKNFDEHVSAPQSFVGNNTTGSINELVQRLSFNEDTNHGTGTASDTNIRNTAANSNYPYTGSAKVFADENNYSSVVDRLKIKLPKIGGIRRSANKSRISPRQLKDEFKGSLNISTRYRVEKSTGTIETKDSERLGIYFSPVDVINEDIIFTLSDLDLEDKLGDPRDDSRDTYDKYGGLQELSNKYWRKYTGSNNFWDYLRLLNYYDHSIFNQVKKLIPARAKATVGVLIENNILERNKIRREIPFREYPVFEDTLSKLKSSGSDYFELLAETNTFENTPTSSNIFTSDAHMAELKSFENNIEKESSFNGSVVNFGKNYMNWGNQYSGSYVTNGASSVFTESIKLIVDQRSAKHNQEKVFIFDTKEHFYQNSASSVSFNSSSFENLSDDHVGTERSFFLGSKNTKETALPSKDLSGQITYDAVTSVLTNPYVTVTTNSPNVKLTTELDLGGDNLNIKDDD